MVRGLTTAGVGGKVADVSEPVNRLVEARMTLEALQALPDLSSRVNESLDLGSSGTDPVAAELGLNAPDGYIPPSDSLKEEPASGIYDMSKHPLVRLGPKGELRYVEGGYDRLVGDLRRLFGNEAVTELGHGVFTVINGLGLPVVIQPQKYAKPVVDFSDMTSVVPNAKPIIFFKPVDRGINSITPIGSWISGMRMLGFNIIYVTNVSDLKDAVTKYQPDFVCFSGTGDDWPELQKGFFAAKEARPEIVTLMGGFGAVKEAARAFDIVVTDEGEIKLPVLLRHLQVLKEMGLLKNGEAVPWFEKIPELKALFDSLPDAVKTFLKKTAYYPPRFSDDVALDLLGLSLERFVDVTGGKTIYAYPIFFGAGVYVRGSDRIVYVEGDVEAENLGVPANEIELDILSGQIDTTVGNIDGRTATIYTQKGCKGGKRCFYCAIKSRPGRRMSPGNALKLRDNAIARGAKRLNYFDDHFPQNMAWTEAVLDGIEADTLAHGFPISVESRIDAISFETLDRMLDQGLEIGFGLETFDPDIAEALGKVPKGEGKRYIERARAVIDHIGQYIKAHPKANRRPVYMMMINIPYGGGILTAARQIRLQMEEVERVWNSYGYALIFMNTPVQRPGIGDLVTTELSGYPDAQPMFMGSDTIPDSYYALKHVGVKWLPFGFEKVADDVIQFGVAMPGNFISSNAVDQYNRFMADREPEANYRNIPFYQAYVRFFRKIQSQMTGEEASQMEAEIAGMERVLNRGALEKAVFSYRKEELARIRSIKDGIVKAYDELEKFLNELELEGTLNSALLEELKKDYRRGRRALWSGWFIRLFHPTIGLEMESRAAATILKQILLRINQRVSKSAPEEDLGSE